MLTLLVYLVFGVVVLGVAYWATTLIPLPPVARTIVNIAIAVIALIFLLYLAGSVLPPLPGRLR